MDVDKTHTLVVKVPEEGEGAQHFQFPIIFHEYQ